MAGDNPVQPKDLWEEIGIHRALGGVWYRSVIRLVAMIFLFVVGAIVIPSIAPYPSVIGYEGVVKQMMALTFTLFDVGIGSSLIRFVAEYRVKDLGRAIQYASFFIWFQAFTGIIQITAIAGWALWALPSTNVAYIGWFVLVYSLVQWPSSTGLFRDLLKAFQHHGKAQLVEILQSFIEVATQVVSILIFRQWGIDNPQYGELLGITVGWIIGVYIDDVLTMFIAGKWFATVLKQISGGSYKLIDIIRPNFSRGVIKDSLTFGLQNMGTGIVDSIKATILVQIWISFMPSYAFYMGIVTLVQSLTMNAGGELNGGLIPAITESHNAGKMHLSRYYIAQGFKYTFFFIVFADVLNFAVFPFLLGAVLEITGTYFLLAVVAIPYQVIVWNFDPLNEFFREVMKNTGHVTLFLILTIITMGIDLLSAVIFLQFMTTSWLVLILFSVPGKIFLLAFTMLFVYKKVIKFEIPLWQSFGAPGLAAVFYFLFSYFFTQYSSPIFLGLDPLGGAIIMLAISFLLIPMFVYLPLYALFGGFDEQGLRDFEKAVAIAGPSRWLMRPSFRVASRIARWNPLKLHNRFPIPIGEAFREIGELMELKAKQSSSK